MRFVDDFLDFLLFIALLGVGLSVAFTVVIPSFNEVDNSVAYVDKSTPEYLGYEVNSDYDGKLSKLEAVLVSQVQDFDLPEPKVFTVGTNGATMIRVNETYESEYNLNSVKNQVVSWLNSLGGNDTRFELKYNYGFSSIGGTEVLTNGGAESYNYSPDGDLKVVGWETFMESSSIEFDVTPSAIAGSRSFLISSPAGGSGVLHQGYWYQNLTAKPNTRYELTSDMYCINCDGVVEVNVTSQDSKTKTYRSKFVSRKNKPDSVSIPFVTANDTKNIQVKLMKIDSHGGGTESFVIDNVSLKTLPNSDPHYEIRKASN